MANAPSPWRSYSMRCHTFSYRPAIGKNRRDIDASAMLYRFDDDLFSTQPFLTPY
jgi:hypothetical protein